MTYKCKMLVIAAGILLMLSPMSALADDASLGAVGYGVVPLQNDQVTMVAERVEAEIGAGDVKVTCVFTFTNTGPATDVLMGFPQAQASQVGADPELRDFRVYVDGEEVPVAFKPQAEPEGEGDYAGWHTFDVAFDAGQTRVVRNTYSGRLTQISDGSRAFEYVLRTGATWKGPIGQADIVVRWQSERDLRSETILAQPSGYAQKGRELAWHFTDLEPTVDDDIRVHFRPVYGPHNLGVDPALWGQLPVARTDMEGMAVALIADGDPSTAWRKVRQTEGASLTWSWGYAAYAHYASPSLGLGILPGMAGSEESFQAHGRPKDALVRFVRPKEGVDDLPVFMPSQLSFRHPDEAFEVSEHRLTLDDAPAWQYVLLDEPADVLAFQIVVESVYPGDQADDVAIAEIRFPLLAGDLTSGMSTLPVTGGERPDGARPMLHAIAFVSALCVLAGGAMLWSSKRAWL